MTIGVAADHGGLALKEHLLIFLQQQGYTCKDFGASRYDAGDDYPDYVLPLARAVATGTCTKGIAVCGSGVGASVAANKIKGVRAALIHDHFSAHQGVEDDDMNIICLGGRVTGEKAAEELVMAFLQASFSGAERHQRRLQKIQTVENQES